VFSFENIYSHVRWDYGTSEVPVAMFTRFAAVSIAFVMPSALVAVDPKPPPRFKSNCANAPLSLRLLISFSVTVVKFVMLPHGGSTATSLSAEFTVPPEPTLPPYASINREVLAAIQL